MSKGDNSGTAPPRSNFRMEGSADIARLQDLLGKEPALTLAVVSPRTASPRQDRKD